MLSPTLSTYCRIIGSFQVFTQAFVMTNGGPVNATLFYVLYLYRNAFQWWKMAMHVLSILVYSDFNLDPAPIQEAKGYTTTSYRAWKARILIISFAAVFVYFL